MSEHPDHDLYRAVDAIFYDRPADYTNQYPLLSLDEDLDTLRKLIMPEMDNDVLDYLLHSCSLDMLLDISDNIRVQTRGYGHYYLEGPRQLPFKAFDICDSAQLSGDVTGLEIRELPSYDTASEVNPDDAECTPCIIIKNATLHLRNESLPLSLFNVSIPVNSSKLGIDRVLNFDEIV